MVVATAMLTMFAELRIKLVSAAMTPYRVRSTALMIELVFGEWNKPVPALCIINMITIHKTGKSVDRHVANMNAEQVDNPNPARVNFRHPNLSYLEILQTLKLNFLSVLDLPANFWLKKLNL